MYKFFKVSAIALATMASLGISTVAHALPGRGCPNFYWPSGGWAATQYPNSQIYLKLSAKDKDKFPKPMTIYVNGIPQLTDPDGYWEGWIFNGIGRITVHTIDYNQCGAGNQEALVVDVTF